MQSIKIYEIKKEYIKYLSQYQKHIFYDEGSRKYIGILLKVNN
ncbi:MAG: type III toxin-antitoxin system ToxN/AbiQ family toxin [Lachnospiraceae bacterium]|nr:type III toxin-antitoxin system ToxN/AbiQ family toxin [Lachnospiraceae bacterium]